MTPDDAILKQVGTNEFQVADQSRCQSEIVVEWANPNGGGILRWLGT
jgi:hypothetical protein